MTTYYVSTSGSDSNSGTASGNAFRTLAQAQAQSLNPGDSILLNGGETFPGPLNIPYAGQINGNSANPITVGSYGSGQATIQITSGDDPCIFIGGASYITIENLILIGAYSSPGIAAYKTTNGMANGLTIDNVTISGCTYGIQILGESGGGWAGVTITDSTIDTNLLAGIEMSGPAATTTPAYCHKQLTISGCTVRDNAGNNADTSEATGFGIRIGALNGGIISGCSTFGNGSQNECTSQAPAGVKLYNCAGVAITGCISYNNTSSTSSNAYGYDLDYNCTSCQITNCVAHGNDGPGIAVITSQSNTAHTGCVISDNLTWGNSKETSTGTATAGYGEFYTSGAVFSLQVSNNTFIGRTSSGVQPPCVVLNTTGLTGANFANNNFLQKSTGPVVQANAALTTANALFDQNAYQLGGTNYVAWNSTNYTTISAWIAAVTGEEPGTYFTAVLS